VIEQTHRHTKVIGAHPRATTFGVNGKYRPPFTLMFREMMFREMILIELVNTWLERRPSFVSFIAATD
jgi:hypothetical protein